MKTKFNFSILLYLLPIALLFNCEPAVDPIRTFTVHAGDHYASPRVVESLQSQTLVFEARFNESAIYDLGSEALQSNKNKLMGFADCNSLHHDNSARFGWQWFNNRLEIYAYCYVNSQRQEKFIGVVELNKFNRFEIQIANDQYIFRLENGEPIAVPRGSTCDVGLYYLLWPYFGGDVAAPHDVSVDIKMISC